MKASRDETLTQPFVLTASDLKTLHNRFQKWVNDFSFEITSKDSLTREFSTLDELLLFENPPKRDILSLRIRGYSNDHKIHLSIRFDGDASRNIRISIEGNEEASVSISDSVEETLAALKPWYSLLARANFYVIMYAIMLVPMAILLLSVGFGMIKLRSDASFDMAALVHASIKGMIWGVIPPVFGFLLHKIQRGVFPMGVFAIGQGAKRHKDRETMRTVVVVAFFISLASSIVATLLFTLWR